MNTLSAIIIASLAGSLLSVGVTGLLVLRAAAPWVSGLVSYAIGTLLGASFLALIPETFEAAASPQVMSATLLAGILIFFMLEKLALWRHHHIKVCEAHVPAEDRPHIHRHPHGEDHGRSGLMITIGDTFHNFVDGILIAAAFLTNFELGVVTALAIIAHEIPQEAGDFLVLLHSGYSKRQAMLLNLLASLAALVGGVLGYFALGAMQVLVPYMLGIAAASMIYVAVADLIPILHKRPELYATAQQVLLIALGITTIWLTSELLH